jgi:hypothetical protein
LLYAPGETEIALEVTVRPPPVAVNVCVLAVLNLTAKGFAPETRVAEGGMVPDGSVEVIVIRLVFVVTVFPTESFAVTLMVKAVPAVAVAGTRVNAREVAGPADTVMAAVVAEVKVPELAVMVLDPGVFNINDNVAVPLVSGALAGSTAAASVEVKDTAVEYPVTVLLLASFAVTVIVNATPAAAVVGAEVKTSLVAAPAVTVIAGEVEVMEPPVAVKVTLPAVFKVTL